MAAADPARRSTAARLAALTRWSREDGREGTRAAKAGFMRRFELQVDPDGQLPEAERIKRAKRAMRAHMTALSIVSRDRRAATA